MTKLKTNASQESGQSVQETVQKMQNDYARTGIYQAKDLDFVLGDPRKIVTITVDNNYSGCTERPENIFEMSSIYMETK